MRDESLLAEVPADTPVRRVPFGGRGLLGAGGRGGTRSRALTTLLRLASRWILVPDSYVGWARRAESAALEEITIRQAALLFTTSSPDSSHLLGRRLKRATGLPWVADFRDPWTRRLSYAPPTPLHHRRHLALERACLREADAVVVTTPETRDDFLARHPGVAAAKFRVIPNGFDEDDFTAAATANRSAQGDTGASAAEAFPILHAGQLNLERSLAPFLAGLRLLRDRNPGRQARATMLGPCYDVHRHEVSAAGLGDAVRFLPGRSHVEAVAAMLNAGVLLLLEDNSDRGGLVLPGKVFEYLRAGRPILGVVPPGGAAARFLRETGAGLAADPSRPEEIADALGRLLDAGGASPESKVPVASFERRVLAGELASLFDSLVRG
jgi:glycosyltransferase involved in cell wall biosynthesis